MHGSSNLVCFLSALEHYAIVSIERLKEHQRENLLKDNSSSVRPDVSGKKKYIKTISNASQQQYTISHLHAMRSSPIGLT
jgi:hypothetical protein